MTDPLAKRNPYPTLLAVGERKPGAIALVVNSAVEGNLNVIGQVLVKAGTIETRIDDPRISPQSFFCFQFLNPVNTGPHVVVGFYLKERGTRTALFGHQAPTADTWVEYMVIG